MAETKSPALMSFCFEEVSTQGGEGRKRHHLNHKEHRGQGIFSFPLRRTRHYCKKETVFISIQFKDDIEQF
jgi:hypothetical protein